MKILIPDESGRGTSEHVDDAQAERPAPLDAETEVLPPAEVQDLRGRPLPMPYMPLLGLAWFLGIQRDATRAQQHPQPKNLGTIRALCHDLRQPLATASNTPPPNGDLERLLTMWRDLAVRAAQAAAHGDEQEFTFTALQLEVEQAITDRHSELSGVMDEALVWESTLVHFGSGPARTCLSCRRARRRLPDNLPFPSPQAGVR
jgi:hypothetical protein